MLNPKDMTCFRICNNSTSSHCPEKLLKTVIRGILIFMKYLEKLVFLDYFHPLPM